MRSLPLLIALALALSACGDHPQPLEPASTGALLATQGQRPQNPQVEVIRIDDDFEFGPFCVGYPGFPDGIDVRFQFSGQIRVMRIQHPVTGALREMHISQGVTATLTANNRSARSNQAGPVVYQFDAQGNPTQMTVLGLSWALVAPGWGVILLEAGRLVIDLATGEVLFEAGPHQLTHADLAEACAYFTS